MTPDGVKNLAIAAIVVAAVAVVVGVWGVVEGKHANKSGKALTEWVDTKVIDWARHTTWHDHVASQASNSPSSTDTKTVTQVPSSEARSDHLPPPPPPPKW